MISLKVLVPDSSYLHPDRSDCMKDILHAFAPQVPCSCHSDLSIWHTPLLLHPIMRLWLHRPIVLLKLLVNYGPHFLSSAPAIPPPCCNPEFAALVIAYTLASVMSPCLRVNLSQFAYLISYFFSPRGRVKFVNLDGPIDSTWEDFLLSSYFSKSSFLASIESASSYLFFSSFSLYIIS